MDKEGYVFFDGSSLFGRRNNSYLNSVKDGDRWIISIGIIQEELSEDGEWNRKHINITGDDEDYMVARANVTEQFSVLLESLDFNLWTEEAKPYLIEDY